MTMQHLHFLLVPDSSAARRARRALVENGACSGVVVNDNLVLLDRVRQLRNDGADLMEALTNAGVDRFRPIVLTSLTTFIGLLPVLFEQSTQAAFLIPMAISLSFGVLFSSGVTLIMVPCAYLSGHSLGEFFRQTGQRLSSRFRSVFAPGE